MGSFSKDGRQRRNKFKENKELRGNSKFELFIIRAFEWILVMQEDTQVEILSGKKIWK